MEKSCLGKHDIGLIIVGGDKDADPRIETQEMQRLRKMVSRLNLEEEVAFWGAQRQDLLPFFYSAAEAIILPSRYESFGMVALEAMGCGMPVIASRVGGLQFTVEDGRTGFLFPEGNWRELAERIREVIVSPQPQEEARSGGPEEGQEVQLAESCERGPVRLSIPPLKLSS